MAQRPKMDPKLVAAQQQYEVNYFKRKHNLTKDQAIAIIKQAGNSRIKANELASKIKN